MEITAANIEAIHQKVLQSENYGREGDLITSCFRKFPKNDDLDIIAMKVSLIDTTNSTKLSSYKSRISVVELAEKIKNIKNIDERIASGDPSVVVEIAKANGKINLFVFASKYCCYHNANYYGRDDYSIFDTVLKKHLPDYFDDITTNQLEKMRINFQYKEYNDYITRKLDELNIHIPNRKRKFDHFVWYNHRTDN